jgi:hypothetical protein
LMASSARRSTAAPTASATAEAAAGADGCGAMVAVERAGEGAVPVPWPAQAAQRAGGRPGRRMATRVTRRSRAERRCLEPTFEPCVSSRKSNGFRQMVSLPLCGWMLSLH